MNDVIFDRIFAEEEVFKAMTRDLSLGQTLNRFVGYSINNQIDFTVLFALLFAEIGKPTCRQENWDDEKQCIRYDYPNLNIISSRLAEDIMVRHNFEPMEVYRICWLIEHIDSEISDELRETVTRYIGIEVYRMFKYQMVRIPNNFVGIDPLWRGFDKPKNLIEDVKPKRIYFPIAASASGKSTICETMVGNDGEFLKTRYDSLRREIYSEDGKYDYWHCIEMSLNDPEWEIKAETIYVDMLKSGKNILFDNCNVLYDDRRHQIKLARNYGYEVIALTIPISLETLKYRQDHRRTKLTPWVVSEQQYFELQQPLVGTVEFDYIIPLDWR